MNKKLFSLLLICLFVSIVGVAFHHHKDGTSHDDCPICAFVSHHANFVFQNTPQISAPSFNVLLTPLENTVSFLFLSYHPYSNRAPPA
jgi:hypothetical protein